MDIEKTKTIVFLSVVSVLIFTSLVSSTSVYAQDSSNMQMPTDKGTLEVVLSIDPFPPQLRQPIKINLEFINPSTNNPQTHVDYRATIVQDGQGMFTTYLQHTNSGKDSFSYAFMVEGEFQLEVSLEGINFSPIPKETVIFPLLIGEKSEKEISVELETEIGSGDSTSSNESKTAIPDWIRNNAEWWAQGAISDSDFTSGIQFLIKDGIIQIPETAKSSTGEGTQEIPSWIKNNADWWSQGLISDDDFVKGIQFLVEQGIIVV